MKATTRAGSKLIAAIAAATLLAAAPATAQTKRFKDAAGDTGGPDLLGATVAYGHGALKVTIDHTDYSNQPDIIDVYIYFDTDPHRPGPEYRLLGTPAGPGTGLTHVIGFSQGEGGRSVRCPGQKNYWVETQPLKTTIPSSCLGNPRKLRVAILTGFEYGDIGTVDWMAAENTFLPWVHRN